MPQIFNTVAVGRNSASRYVLLPSGYCKYVEKTTGKKIEQVTIEEHDGGLLIKPLTAEK
jgi:hypothetical protein